jgi:hypothetical protein
MEIPPLPLLETNAVSARYAVQCAGWSLTPSLRKIDDIKHHLVMPDWNRFNPTNAVKRNQ